MKDQTPKHIPTFPIIPNPCNISSNSIKSTIQHNPGYNLDETYMLKRRLVKHQVFHILSKRTFEYLRVILISYQFPPILQRVSPTIVKGRSSVHSHATNYYNPLNNNITMTGAKLAYRPKKINYSRIRCCQGNY